MQIMVWQRAPKASFKKGGWVDVGECSKLEHEIEVNYIKLLLPLKFWEHWAQLEHQQFLTEHIIIWGMFIIRVHDGSLEVFMPNAGLHKPCKTIGGSQQNRYQNLRLSNPAKRDRDSLNCWWLFRQTMKWEVLSQHGLSRSKRRSLKKHLVSKTQVDLFKMKGESTTWYGIHPLRKICKKLPSTWIAHTRWWFQIFSYTLNLNLGKWSQVSSWYSSAVLTLNWWRSSVR